MSGAVPYILIGLGGAAGALLRHLAARALNQVGPEPFPWGTLFVNLLGCLLVGFFFVLCERRLPEGFRLLALTGLLGAFTTFSTFHLEGLSLLLDGLWGRALVYVLGSNLLGLALVGVGLLLGRAVDVALG